MTNSVIRFYRVVALLLMANYTAFIVGVADSEPKPDGYYLLTAGIICFWGAVGVLGMTVRERRKNLTANTHGCRL